MSHKLLVLRCVLIMEHTSHLFLFLYKDLNLGTILQNIWYNSIIVSFQHWRPYTQFGQYCLCLGRRTANNVCIQNKQKKIARKQNQRKVKRLWEREPAVIDSSSTVASWHIIDNKVKLKIHNWRMLERYISLLV